MIEASCHCGAVRFTVETAPAELNDCNCSICRRQGAWWGYYDPKDVRFATGNGPTDTYLWRHKILVFHRCRTCGCLTHWAPADGVYPRMGINARLMPPEITATIPIVHGDGASA